MTTIEVHKRDPDGETATADATARDAVATFDPRVEVLRGEVDSVPANGFRADGPDAIGQVRRELHTIIDDIEASYESDEPEAAAELVRTGFEPALDEALEDEYEADGPLERSRQSVETAAADTVERTLGLAGRFDDGDGVIQAREVLSVIGAFNGGDGDITAREVLSVITAFNGDRQWSSVDT